MIMYFGHFKTVVIRYHFLSPFETLVIDIYDIYTFRSKFGDSSIRYIQSVDNLVILGQ